MTHLDDAHPEPEQLVAFGVGRVRGEAATAIEEHLSHCSICCDALARPLDDELIRLVRTYPDGPEASWGSLRLQRGFEVLSELGRGGMGIVYKARQPGLGRLVALKRARPGGGAEELIRFRREAEAAARLRHPNIVQIYEVGEQDGLPYLAMEYVEGGTLAAHLGGTPAPPRAAAEMARAVALAVHYAHQNGVVHRDLKPENILLSTGRDPKVADFGLAKLLDQAQGNTRTGAVLGTPKYMAPEQATGRAKEIGPATDVYALGVVLYEMLTGRVPFAGATALDTLEQVCTHEPAPPRRLQPGVPRELETICLKALEKAPARRYATAAALAEDLGRFLDGRPILARPAGVFERLYKAARRRPAWATLAVLAALTVVGSVGGVLYHNARLREQVERADWQAARAIEEKDRADDQYHQAWLALVRMLEVYKERGTELSKTIPQLGELRRAQSEHALAFFEGIVARQDDPGPRQRADLAAACKEAARLQMSLGKDAAAEKNLRRAIRILEEMKAETTGDRVQRENLSACYTYLGLLYFTRIGAGEEAASWGKKGVDVAERLVRDFPREAHLKHNLAQDCSNLATLHRDGAPDTAVELYERAMRLGRELHRDQPKHVVIAVGLAETCLNLGSLYVRLGKPDQAAVVFQESLSILEPLSTAHPSVVWYATSLAALRICLGGLWQNQGREKEALQQYDMALAALRTVLGREPNYALAREQLLPGHGGRAQTLSKLGRYADSLKDWDRVLELAPEANRAAYRLERAGVLIQAGELTKAAAEADAVAGAAKAEAVYLLVAGALHARIATALAGKPSQAEAHAAQAMAWLQKARDAGFFKQANQAAYLKDEDFVSLRARGDFQKLLREVAEALPKAK